MKIRVTIDEQSYEVEVGDLNARPILAAVEGETFQVWPEEAESQPVEISAPVSVVKTAPAAALPAAHTNGNGSHPVNSAKAVLAPIPGVIISLNVKEGQTVAFGQDLCILEAMKMKNVIRSNRAGTIAAVRVAPGDQVKRSQVLIEYSD